MNSTSPSLSLNSIDWKKGLIRFALYMLAAAFVFIAAVVKHIDFSSLGVWGPLLTTVFGFIFDMTGKFFADHSTSLPPSPSDPLA